MKYQINESNVSPIPPRLTNYEIDLFCAVLLAGTHSQFPPDDCYSTLISVNIEIEELYQILKDSMMIGLIQ